MIDRASTFANLEILDLLRARFVPVALDQAYERRENDAWGEFYRQFAGAGPRKDFQGTTQGFYVANAAGDLLLYNNNRDPEKLLRLLRQTIERFDASAAAHTNIAKLDVGVREARYAPKPPEGGLVLRVRSRVLGGYPTATNEFERAMQQSIGRDQAWITGEEHRSLVAGTMPSSLCERLARFHLVDNTRGEPTMWTREEIKISHAHLASGQLRFEFELASKDGKRSFRGTLMGTIEVAEERVSGMDLVARGIYTGSGQYTKGAPPEPFPFVTAFALATGEEPADRIPPQGSRGWIDGYLTPR